jgi:hypothetical protein
LNALIANARLGCGGDKIDQNKRLLPEFCRPGGLCVMKKPDPIPNSAVKRDSADGTKAQALGE